MRTIQVIADANIGYFWHLNNMMSNYEHSETFGPFDSEQHAIDWLDEQRTDPYTEDGPDMFSSNPKSYRKVFKKGSILEWFNPPDKYELNTNGYTQHGLYEHYIDIFNIQKA
jgi:hypothetical protein